MCTLCRRNLLVGERYRHWKQTEEKPAGIPVCGLCEPEAARAGWVKSSDGYEREGSYGLRPAVRLVA